MADKQLRISEYTHVYMHDINKQSSPQEYLSGGCKVLNIAFQHLLRSVSGGKTILSGGKNG